jgi:hypothetical protein
MLAHFSLRALAVFLVYYLTYSYGENLPILFTFVGDVFLLLQDGDSLEPSKMNINTQMDHDVPNATMPVNSVVSQSSTLNL